MTPFSVPANNRAHGEGRDEKSGGDLDAEGEDGDDEFEDEGEGELPDGRVDAVPRLRDGYRLVHVREVAVDVVAETRLQQYACLRTTNYNLQCS